MVIAMSGPYYVDYNSTFKYMYLSEAERKLVSQTQYDLEELMEDIAYYRYTNDVDDIATIAGINQRIIEANHALKAFEDRSQEIETEAFCKWIATEGLDVNDWYLVAIDEEWGRRIDRLGPDYHPAEETVELMTEYDELVADFRATFPGIGDDDIRAVDAGQFPLVRHYVLVRAREAFNCRLQGRDYVSLA